MQNDLAVDAAIKGDAALLRTLRQYTNWSTVCATAAQYGHLECLKVAYNDVGYWDSHTIYNAVAYGHVECFKYACENECDWHRETTLLASQLGHLQILQLAYKYNCPWNYYTAYMAAKYGHFTCLQFAIEKGCPYDDNELLKSVLEYGNLEHIAYVLKTINKRFVVSFKPCFLNAAIQSKNMSVVELVCSWPGEKQVDGLQSSLYFCCHNTFPEALVYIHSTYKVPINGDILDESARCNACFQYVLSQSDCPSFTLQTVKTAIYANNRDVIYYLLSSYCPVDKEIMSLLLDSVHYDLALNITSFPFFDSLLTYARTNKVASFLYAHGCPVNPQEMADMFEKYNNDIDMKHHFTKCRILKNHVELLDRYPKLVLFLQTSTLHVEYERAHKEAFESVLYDDIVSVVMTFI